MQIHISKSKVLSPLGVFCSLISGITLFLSFTYLPYLVFVSLIPLLFLIDRSSPTSLFYYGLISGFALYIPMLSFILIMDIPIRFYLYLGVFLLWLYLSLYYGLWCSVTRIILSKIGPPGWIVSASLFVSLEFIRSLTRELGFPWGTIGYTLVPQRYLIQIADITGIAGLSFIVIITNILLYKSLKRPRLLISLAIILGITIGYGKWRRESIKKTLSSTTGQRTEVSILVIQPNITHGQKIRGDLESRIETFENLSKSDTKYDLIILPETALPGYMIEGSKLEMLMMDLAKKLDSKILAGGTRLSYNEGVIEIYNSASLVGPEKGVLDYYDKIYLVPFGERLPLDDFFPALKRLQFGQGQFTPGKRRTIFELDGAKFGVLICFESIFPRHVRKFVKEGADFMVNITDDSWFGRTVGPYEHARMAILRTVETRKPFVRCANAGISYIVSPLGEVKHRTKLFEATAISDSIYLNSIETFYTRFGDVFCYVMLSISFGGVCIALYRKRKRVNK